MPITNGYCTLAELKARVNIPTEDTADDTILEAIITATSRQVDDVCRRRFYAAAETRSFTARRSTRLLVDDLLGVSSLKTDADGDGTYEDTWTANTDFALAPYNAPLESQPQPYWEIQVRPSGRFCFPVGVHRGVEVVGSWGFSSSTPAVVKEACLHQAAMAYKAIDAPTGAGADNAATWQLRAIGLHPFVRTMLAPYIRPVIG